jgi:hypothetical protein
MYSIIVYIFGVFFVLKNMIFFQSFFFWSPFGLLRKDQKTYMVVLVYIWFGLKNSEGLNIDLHYLRKCVGLHLV